MKMRTAEHLAPYRVKGPRTYTEQECQLIEQMVRDGFSYAEIGNVVGRSRNAIIGYVHRHLFAKGIGFALSTGPRKEGGGYANRHAKSYYKPTGNRPGRPKGVVNTDTLAPTQKRAPRPKMRAGIPVPDALLIQLEDLRNDQCRWPIGDVGEPGFGFCGHAKFRGSYCEAHAARSVISCA